MMDWTKQEKENMIRGNHYNHDEYIKNLEILDEGVELLKDDDDDEE